MAKSLLLHACCAPCSSRAVSLLHSSFDITLFYYNPNIAPSDEFIRRRDALFLLINRMPEAAGIEIIVLNYERKPFFEAIPAGSELEPEGGERCRACIAMRLRETAIAAKNGGYDYFGTTLTVGPNKKADVINSIGKALAAQFEVSFYECDLKKKGGYAESVELSKKYDIYRQNYCGCEYGNPNLYA